MNMSDEDETITIPKAVKLSVLRNQKKPLADRVEMASQYVCQLAALPSCPNKFEPQRGSDEVSVHSRALLRQRRCFVKVCWTGNC